MKNFCIFICSLSLFASEPYPYRDIKNPPIKLPDDIIIFHLSGGRTGSTLIFNVLTYLFEDNVKSNVHDFNARVIKRHCPLEAGRSKTFKKKRIIITTSHREPLNMVASEENTGKRVIFLRDTIALLDHTNLKIIKKIPFKYELFQNDQFDHIFETLEAALDLTIPEYAKANARKFFSIKEMKKIASRYKNFSQYDDQITNIHGKHIYGSDWRKDLSLETAIKAYNLNYNLRKKWGYQDIDVEKEWIEYHK
ncbi:MAG: hypothetical protein S4CHLAM20_06270 [Chlamydiia bacterium]|nr:hypothetical protein [Chlamydiia bacterium]